MPQNIAVRNSGFFINNVSKLALGEGLYEMYFSGNQYLTMNLNSLDCKFIECDRVAKTVRTFTLSWHMICTVFNYLDLNIQHITVYFLPEILAREKPLFYSFRIKYYIVAIHDIHAHTVY